MSGLSAAVNEMRVAALSDNNMLLICDESFHLSVSRDPTLGIAVLEDAVQHAVDKIVVTAWSQQSYQQRAVVTRNTVAYKRLLMCCSYIITPTGVDR